jgi:branched-chain amino acid transport system permease protein
MYAPGGLASLIMMTVRVIAHKKFKRIFPALLVVSIASLLAFSGAVMLIEMMYHLTLESANGSTTKLMGYVVDTAVPTPWIMASLLFLFGVIAMYFTRQPFFAVWGDVNAEIEHAMKGAH